jgi:chromate transporter
LNVTVIVGSRFHGVPGALAAVLGLIALPLVVVLVLAALYARFGQVPGIDAILHGLGAAVAGLVIATALKMAGSLLRSPRFVGFLAVTFGAIALLHWPLIPVLLGFASVSVLAAWFKRA